MKTKEEIFDKHIEKYTLMQSTIAECMLPAMQEYADQETERIKAELNELKEKHKKDVMKAYIDADPHFLIEEDAEEYYKQKFESND